MFGDITSYTLNNPCNTISLFRKYRTEADAADARWSLSDPAKLYDLGAQVINAEDLDDILDLHRELGIRFIADTFSWFEDSGKFSDRLALSWFYVLSCNGYRMGYRRIIERVQKIPFETIMQKFQAFSDDAVKSLLEPVAQVEGASNLDYADFMEIESFYSSLEWRFFMELPESNSRFNTDEQIDLLLHAFSYQSSDLSHLSQRLRQTGCILSENQRIHMFVPHWWSSIPGEGHYQSAREIRLKLLSKFGFPESYEERNSILNHYFRQLSSNSVLVNQVVPNTIPKEPDESMNCSANPSVFSPAAAVPEVSPTPASWQSNSPDVWDTPMDPPFDFNLIHTNISAEELSRMLAPFQTGKNIPGARFLFYGEPGTGKSAFGRHIADRLRYKFVYRRSSEILTHRLGDAERNIAAIFSEASKPKTILMIDEIDGLIYDRKHMFHSWEGSIINEFLTQLESFKAMFIATTNLLRSLDQALLRRLPWKIEFLPLREESILSAMKLYFPVQFESDTDDLSGLTGITLGDVGAVYLRVLPQLFSDQSQVSQKEIIDALIAEKSIRTPNSNSSPIGFQVVPGGNKG